MGHHETFGITTDPAQSVDEAARSVVMVSGYSGDEVGSAEYDLVEVISRPATRSELHKWRDNRTSRGIKACAVRAEVSEAPVNFEVTVKGRVEPFHLDESQRAEVVKAARQHMGPGAVLEDWYATVQSISVGRPSVEVPKARATTVYHVVDVHGRETSSLAGGFATQAEARAAAMELATNGTVSGPLAVRAHVVREGVGDDLLTITPTVRTTTLLVRGTAVTYGKGRSGWAFVGDEHH